VLTRITIPYEDKYLETARRPGITSARMKRFQRIDRREQNCIIQPL
jgi:hypothetical protein